MVVRIPDVKTVPENQGMISEFNKNRYAIKLRVQIML